MSDEKRWTVIKDGMGYWKGAPPHLEFVPGVYEKIELTDAEMEEYKKTHNVIDGLALSKTIPNSLQEEDSNVS